MPQVGVDVLVLVGGEDLERVVGLVDAQRRDGGPGGLLRVIMVSPPFMFSTPAASVSFSASGGAWQSPGHNSIFTGLLGDSTR
jgi:hypothetical protein